MKGQRFLVGVLLLGLWLTLAAGTKPISPKGAGLHRPRADFDGDGCADLAVGVLFEAVGSIADAGAVNVLYGSSGSGLTVAGDQFWYQDSPDVQDMVEMYDHFGSALAVGDFDGDGCADLAVGVFWEGVGSIEDAGAVNVLYGSDGGGLTATGNQLWHQDSPDVEDAAEADDRFGWALAAGDFDGDGCDDLAIGVRDEAVGSIADAGAVNVLYGSSGSGLTATGNQLWHQDSPDVEDAAGTGDWFGSALAVGDFDGDGHDDLAVGVHYEAIGSMPGAGAVNVLYGSDGGGLTATGNQLWHQDSLDVQDTAEAWDYFGQALAAGDFDGDGCDDLAIGVRDEDVGSIADAGAVNVLYGSSGSGLTATGNQFWHQDSPDVEGGAEEDDRFGLALAAGDFDGDGHDDLAVGVPDEDYLTAETDVGAVNVLYGSASGGLTAAGDQVWLQGVAGVADTREAGDEFGAALAVGDFDGDGCADLAVGVPYEAIGSMPQAGAVNVLYGSDGGGLTATGNQFWHQDSPDVEDAAETGDWFGYALAAIPSAAQNEIYLPLVVKNY